MPTINVGDNWQTIVNANPVNTVFTIAVGTHQLATCSPKAGQQFRAAGSGVILEGGRFLTGWASDGAGHYFVGGQSQGGFSQNSGTCLPGFPQCLFSDQLWLGGVLQVPVSALNGLAAGQWFYDYIADKVYLPANPGATPVMISVVRNALKSNAAGVVIEGLTVQHYRPEAQGEGAIDCGSSWIITDITALDNAQSGVGLAVGCRMTGGRMSRNGIYGITASNPTRAIGPIIVDGVEIDHNNTQQVNPGFGAGGSKFSGSIDCIYRNCNSHHNIGNGIWFDVDNHNCEVYGNTVDDNGYQGIFIEISWGAKVHNNTVRRNGFSRGNGAGFGAGILVAASPDVEIYLNTVLDNNNGINGVQQARGSGDNGVHEINNMYVHDNTVRIGAGQYSGLTQSVNDNTYFTSRNNRWQNNHYEILGGNTQPFTWMNAKQTIAQWQAAGQDTTGTFGGATVPTGPGQWSYDVATDTLYVWPIGSVAPTSVPISAFDWRFGMEEIVMVRLDQTLRGRLCRTFHYGYGADPDAGHGAVSYDGSRVLFASNWGGGVVGIYAALVDSAL